MCHKATFAPIFPISGLWRPCMGVNGAKNENSDVHWFANIFFIFLKNLFYKLSLGCNTSHYLMIFLWKLIKNSYSAIKNLKKLWLQAKFSNFWMPLVPIKNILPYSHNKWDKHFISSKKDLSQVPMFVSHNGIKEAKIKKVEPLLPVNIEPKQIEKHIKLAELCINLMHLFQHMTATICLV